MARRIAVRPSRCRTTSPRSNAAQSRACWGDPGDAAASCSPRGASSARRDRRRQSAADANDIGADLETAMTTSVSASTTVL
jgi:hypothetical protein